jgi:hypothetical protein
LKDVSGLSIIGGGVSRSSAIRAQTGIRNPAIRTQTAGPKTKFGLDSADVSLPCSSNL